MEVNELLIKKIWHHNTARRHVVLFLSYYFILDILPIFLNK